MSDKSEILIDGANFYHLAPKALGIKEVDFDFELFVKYLVGDRELVHGGKRYYVGTVREKEGDPHSKKAMARQTRLFSTLKKYNWDIKTSKLRTRMEEIPIDSRVIGYKQLKKKGFDVIKFERKREKGIDVKIATDLIVGAIDEKYDTAILVSSDTDLIPAMDWVRNRKRKKIEKDNYCIRRCKILYGKLQKNQR